MYKTVTLTEVKLVKLEVVDSEVKTTNLPNETLLGNVSMLKAQGQLQKEFDFPITVVDVSPETKVYGMDVLDFIMYADVKEDEENK